MTIVHDKDKGNRNTKVLPMIQEGSNEEKKNDSFSISKGEVNKASGSLTHPNVHNAVSSNAKSQEEGIKKPTVVIKSVPDLALDAA